MAPKRRSSNTQSGSPTQVNQTQDLLFEPGIRNVKTPDSASGNEQAGIWTPFACVDDPKIQSSMTTGIDDNGHLDAIIKSSMSQVGLSGLVTEAEEAATRRNSGSDMQAGKTQARPKSRASAARKSRLQEQRVEHKRVIVEKDREIEDNAAMLAQLRTELADHVKQAQEAGDIVRQLAETLERQQRELERLQSENGILKLASGRRDSSPNERLERMSKLQQAETVAKNEAKKLKHQRDEAWSELEILRKQAAEDLEQARQEARTGQQALQQQCESLLAKATAAEEAHSSLREEIVGRFQAGSVRTSCFKPQVSIFDVTDPKKGLRRIVRIEAPGRSLHGDGNSTVTGAVRPVEKGVSITLTKTADLPDAARFCDEYAFDDSVGTWEWSYQPQDGEWELSESWGFAHGIFAFALNRRVGSSPQNASEIPVIPSGITAMRSKRASAVEMVFPKETGKNCVAVMPPVNSSARAYFRCETVFLGVDGNHIDAEDVSKGVRLWGPQGAVLVKRAGWESNKQREVVTIGLGCEALSILVGTKVASAEVTDDGAAAADWGYYDVRQLQTGLHEVALRAPSGAESTTQLTSLGLLEQQAPALGLELDYTGSDCAVYVLVQRSLSGYMCRPKQEQLEHVGSPFTPRGPFTAPAPHFASPEHRRMLLKTHSWR